MFQESIIIIRESFLQFKGTGMYLALFFFGQHAGSAYVEGEEYSTSKMVFNEDEASITVFDKNGKQIRQGGFSLDMTPNAEHFSIGNLNTSEGTILWPFAINQNGLEPTSFEIGYLGSDAMILIYAPEGTGGWSECTWWSFGK